MIKKLSIFSTVLLLILGITFSNKTSTAYEKTTALYVTTYEEKEPLNVKDQVIISLLNPYIAKQVLKIYGELPQYSIAEAKLQSITQDNDNVVFDVIIQIKTFEGPHNPPYGDDTFRFLITPSSVELLNYNHIARNR